VRQGAISSRFSLLRVIVQFPRICERRGFVGSERTRISYEHNALDDASKEETGEKRAAQTPSFVLVVPHNGHAFAAGSPQMAIAIHIRSPASSHSSPVPVLPFGSAELVFPTSSFFPLSTFIPTFLFPSLPPAQSPCLDEGTLGAASEENNGSVVAPSFASRECLPRRCLRSGLEVQSKLLASRKSVCSRPPRRSASKQSFASLRDYSVCCARVGDGNYHRIARTNHESAIFNGERVDGPLRANLQYLNTGVT